MEATARTHREDELARDYITCLLVIIRKMEIPGLETQFDMLHRNLRAGLQRLVRRADSGISTSYRRSQGKPN